MHSKLNQFTGMFFGIFFIVVASVFAASSYLLEEGEERNIGVGAENIKVEVLIVEDTTPATVTFKVNSQITPQLTQGSSYDVQGRASLDVLDIILNEAGEAGSGDLVSFSFSKYCGDNMCDVQETCGGCAIDCGCEEGYFCENGDRCIEVYCGDNICSDKESCTADDCCNGRIIDDFGSNKYNCGACNNRCGYKEECELGVCRKQPYCGDWICQEGEECTWDCPLQRSRNADENRKVKEVKQEIIIPPKEAVKVIQKEKENEEIVKETTQTLEKEVVIKQTKFFKSIFLWLGKVLQIS